VTVKDTVSGITATRSGIVVAPAAPINLSATAASTSQINLTWTGSAGATGYLIERSLTGTSGWTQIASTSAPTTSFQDTGLAPGTTYFYRVRATGGNVDSGYSNVANATTNSSTTATVDTLWANSYIPVENAQSSGSYELGVKFLASVAGNVTGVRFYKQTFMGGSTHVGHLWSATGRLLATATFTNETASGWQQVNFSSPVAIQANTVYIASFSTGGGRFGISNNYFTSSGVTSGPLQAPANGVSGGNGVYQTHAGKFPATSGSGMNFWADVAFVPSTSAAKSPAGSSPTSPDGAGRGLGGTGTVPTAAPSSLVLTPASAVPGGPSSALAGSRGTAAAPSAASALTPLSWPYRRSVPQVRTPGSWHRNGALSSGSVDG
jgi:hypothetical protein